MTTATINSTKKKNLFLVDPRSIIADHDDNIRVDLGDLTELKLSILENGVKDPVKVQKSGDTYKLIHGFRRHTAIMELIAEGHKTESIARMPVTPVARGYNEEDTVFDHFICNSGKSLTPMEKAEGYKKLAGFGYTQKQIAKRLGVTQANISNSLKLVTVSKKVKDVINQGLISDSLVLDLVKSNKGNTKRVEEIVMKAMEELKEKTGSSSKKKVTAKDIKKDHKPVSKYHRLFNRALEMAQSRNDDALVGKVESLISTLDCTDEEEVLGILTNL